MTTKTTTSPRTAASSILSRAYNHGAPLSELETELAKQLDLLTESIGNDVYSTRLGTLSARATEAERRLAKEIEARVAAEDLCATLTDNLTAVQARCTALLNQNRLANHFDKKESDAGAFLSLAWAIEKARAKHPRGPDGMRSLLEEAGEVANAIRRATEKDVLDELLDVAVVAMRLYMGDCIPGALGPAPDAIAAAVEERIQQLIALGRLRRVDQDEDEDSTPVSKSGVHPEVRS